MAVRATRLRRLRIRRAVSRTTWAVSVLAAGLLYIQMGKSVTIVVDGRAEVVRTDDTSVGQLLELRGIVVDPGDLVLPSPSTTLADGMVVVVERDGVDVPGDAVRNVGVWVVAGGSGRLAKELAAPEVARSAGRPTGPHRINAARVVVRGKARDVVTNAATVRQLLSAMGITPDGNDRVSPPPSTPIPVEGTIRFSEVEFRVREVREKVPHETVSTSTSELPRGEVRILQAGVDGVALHTVQLWVVNGKVVGRWPIDERVVRPAVTERQLVGVGDLGAAGQSTTGTQVGEATWYEPPWSGLTAAHPSLPFGTKVTVTNLDNGKSVTVVINDRGPFGGRIIDLSREAFELIAPLGQGVARVRLVW